MYTVDWLKTIEPDHLVNLLTWFVEVQLDTWENEVPEEYQFSLEDIRTELIRRCKR